MHIPIMFFSCFLTTDYLYSEYKLLLVWEGSFQPGDAESGPGCGSRQVCSSVALLWMLFDIFWGPNSGSGINVFGICLDRTQNQNYLFSYCFLHNTNTILTKNKIIITDGRWNIVLLIYIRLFTSSKEGM